MTLPPFPPLREAAKLFAVSAIVSLVVSLATLKVMDWINPPIFLSPRTHCEAILYTAGTPLIHVTDLVPMVNPVHLPTGDYYISVRMRSY